jgi:predicted RNase H-like HicB family nuclease
MGAAQGTFHVIVHPAEEGGFWAKVVELPGCMSQGETQEETLTNVRAAIMDVLRSYKEDGEPLLLGNTATVETVRVPVPA